MSRYSGTITTTGKSEAIRLEKALFKSHPEFSQRTKVHADVIGPGTMLVSVADDVTADNRADPVMAAFLSFLAQDISRTPARVKFWFIKNYMSPQMKVRKQVAGCMTKQVVIKVPVDLKHVCTMQTLLLNLGHLCAGLCPVHGRSVRL